MVHRFADGRDGTDRAAARRHGRVCPAGRYRTVDAVDEGFQAQVAALPPLRRVPESKSEIMGIAQWLGVPHVPAGLAHKRLAALEYGRKPSPKSIVSYGPGNIYVAG